MSGGSAFHPRIARNRRGIEAMQLDQETTLKLIDSVRIPPAPVVVQEIHRLLQRDDTTLADIGAVIARDVAISSLLLQAVNSPAYGLRSEARSIQHAAGLLGMRNTVNIVAALALRHSLEQDNSEQISGFWDSAANTGLAAAGIARQVGGFAPDEAYMLGLFHNAGHTLMTQRFNDYPGFYEQHINAAAKPVNVYENARYQCNHAVLGYYLAGAWGVSKRLQRVIGEHHDPQALKLDKGKDGDVPLAILKFAEHVDKRFRLVPTDHEWDRCSERVLYTLGLSEVDYEELRDDLLDKLTEGAR
jgi:HD-like signal output (HDOD) protein